MIRPIGLVHSTLFWEPVNGGMAAIGGGWRQKIATSRIAVISREASFAQVCNAIALLGDDRKMVFALASMQRSAEQPVVSGHG